MSHVLVRLRIIFDFFPIKVVLDDEYYGAVAGQIESSSFFTIP
jgi:hypothetical protein